MTTKELRKKHPKFIYEGYKYELVSNDLVIKFRFVIPPAIKFEPKVIIKNVPKSRYKKLDRMALDNLIFHLGMAEIPSYWKATCSQVIRINGRYINADQIIWWKDLIMKGMGQFFYENKINFREKGFLKIVSDAKAGAKRLADVKSDKVLIPVGGGKDSAVTLEVLSKNYKNSGAFVLSPLKSSLDTIKISGVKNLIEVERTIDPKLLKLNGKGYLNGHTPISSVYAFISVFCAYIFGYKNVIFSNERSSNEWNIIYRGQKINHQYSKTFEFENNFRQYNKKYLSNINYSSFLRPLYELQISKIFSKYPKYFSAIRSCNRGQKMGGIWCCQCPKCLSTFILLYPFLGKDKINKIFPGNLYEDLSLYSLLEDSILANKVKPFECVGTREELRVGLYLSTKFFKNGKMPYLLQKVWNEHISKEKGLEKISKNLLNNWNYENNLSKEFKDHLKKEL